MSSEGLAERKNGLKFLKLGGSLITDKSKPYTARLDIIQRLCAEIYQARQRGVRLLLGHGSGSFGHISATRYQTDRGAVNEKSWEGFVAVHQDAEKLNRMVCEGLSRAGALAFPVQFSCSGTTQDGRIRNWYTRPIQVLLEEGVIPVLYGDVGIDGQKGMCVVSTEEIFRFLSAVFRPQRIIMAGKVDGVVDAEGRLIRSITHSTFDRLRSALLPSDGFADVTGGMLHKIERSLEMGVPTQIINGLKPDLLLRVLMNDVGEGTTVGGG